MCGELALGDLAQPRDPPQAQHQPEFGNFFRGAPSQVQARFNPQTQPRPKAQPQGEIVVFKSEQEAGQIVEHVPPSRVLGFDLTNFRVKALGCPHNNVNIFREMNESIQIYLPYFLYGEPAYLHDWCDCNALHRHPATSSASQVATWTY